MTIRPLVPTIIGSTLIAVVAFPQVRPTEQRPRVPRPAATATTTSVGFFKSVGGLSSETEVVDYKEGGVSGFTRRIVGKTGLSFRMGLSAAPGFFDWVEDFFMGRRNPKNGAIRLSDADFKVRAQREFKDALITEINFPKLEASSNERAYLDVTITPETMTAGVAQGQTELYRDPNARQKTWLCSNFRLKLGNLPTSRVTKVDGFAIKQSHVYQHNQTDLEFLRIRFYIPDSEFAKWPAKAQSANLHATGNEIAIETIEIAHEGMNFGSLEFLDPSRQRLGQLEFRLKDLRAAPAAVNGVRSLLITAQRPRLKVE